MNNVNDKNMKEILSIDLLLKCSFLTQLGLLTIAVLLIFLFEWIKHGRSLGHLQPSTRKPSRQDNLNDIPNF